MGTSFLSAYEQIALLTFLQRWSWCIHLRVSLSIALPVLAIELLAEQCKANPVNICGVADMGQVCDDCRNTFLHSDNNFSQHFTV